MKRKIVHIIKFISIPLIVLSLLLIPLCAETKNSSDSPLLYDISELYENARFYFYNQLNSIERGIYDDLMCLPENTDTITFNNVPYNDANIKALARAYDAFILDNPEKSMIWYRPFAYSTYEESENGGITLTLMRSPIYSPYKYEKAMARANAIAAEINKQTDFYLRTHDLVSYLFLNMWYSCDVGAGMAGFDTIGEYSLELFYNDCAYGCLLNNTAVCEGFSDTVKLLCNLCNIPCIKVNNGGHAWNFVQMEDGNWYSIDLAGAYSNCDDQVYIAEHFLLGSESDYYVNDSNYFIESIGFEKDFSYPILNKEQYILDLEYIYIPISEHSGFLEPEVPQFDIEILEDDTCRILGYEGSQNRVLTIPKTIDGYTVTEIGSSAFLRTNFIGDLMIPNTIKRIGGGAFEGSSFDGSLIFEEESSLTFLGNYVFAHCAQLTGDVIIPNSVASCGELLLYECTSLDGIVTLPDCLSSFDADFCYGSPVKSIQFYKTNPFYSIYDDCIYSKDGTTLIYCPPEKTGILHVRDGCTKINGSACSNRIIQNVVFPNSLEEIGEWAFSGHCFVGDLVIPEGVTKIGQFAFITNNREPGGNNGTLVLPQSLVEIGDRAFTNCFFNGVLYLPENLENIGRDIFHANDFYRIFYDSNSEFWANNHETVLNDFSAYMFYPMIAPKCEHCIPSENTNIKIVEEPFSPNYSIVETYCEVCGNLLDAAKYEHQLIDNVTVKHSTTFAEALAYNYYITLGENGKNFGIYDRVWLELKIRDYSSAETYEYSDGNGVGYNIKKVTLENWTEYVNQGVKSYRFSLRNIYAFEAGNWIEATLFATKGNDFFCTDTDYSSIMAYAFTGLANSQSEKFHRLLVDMLNYSAAAQIYFNYNTSDLANTYLTDEQKLLGTQEEIVPNNAENSIPLEGAQGRFTGKSLVFANSIELKYYFEFDSGIDVKDVVLRLSYTSNIGSEVVKEILGSEFVYVADRKQYSAKLTTIAAYDAGKTVTAVLYKDGKPISETLEYGIEAYAKAALERSTSTTYKALVQNMLKYTRSAGEYFQK